MLGNVGIHLFVTGLHLLCQLFLGVALGQQTGLFKHNLQLHGPLLVKTCSGSLTLADKHLPKLSPHHLNLFFGNLSSRQLRVFTLCIANELIKFSLISWLLEKLINFGIRNIGTGRSSSLRFEIVLCYDNGTNQFKLSLQLWFVRNSFITRFLGHSEQLAKIIGKPFSSNGI